MSQGLLEALASIPPPARPDPIDYRLPHRQDVQGLTPDRDCVTATTTCNLPHQVHHHEESAQEKSSPFSMRAGIRGAAEMSRGLRRKSHGILEFLASGQPEPDLMDKPLLLHQEVQLQTLKSETLPGQLHQDRKSSSFEVKTSACGSLQPFPAD